MVTSESSHSAAVVHILIEVIRVKFLSQTDRSYSLCELLYRRVKLYDSQVLMETFTIKAPVVKSKTNSLSPTVYINT